MEIESSSITGGGEGSTPMGQVDGPLVMSSPVETLTASSLSAEFEFQPEISAEGQQPETGWPSDLTASTSSPPLLLTYGPSEPPLWRYRRNQLLDIPGEPLTQRLMPSGVVSCATFIQSYASPFVVTIGCMSVLSAVIRIIYPQVVPVFTLFIS